MHDPLLASDDLCDLPVYDVASIPVGRTFGVLVEAETGLVRYFDVDLDNRRRHVLVPVGHARVEKHLGRMRLRLRAATARELDRIPAYEPHTSWRDDLFQNELLTAFGRLFEGQRYYAHPAYDHSGLYAGAHPLLRAPLAPLTASGLQRLSVARGFRVAFDESDIRGWQLVGENQSPLGRVNDLIIDPDGGQVRYVVVGRESDGCDVILPIGYLSLRDQTVSTRLSADDLRALPPFSGTTLERAHELRVRTVLDSALAGSRRYLRPDFGHAA